MRKWSVLWEEKPNHFNRWTCRAVNIVEAINRWQTAHQRHSVNVIVDVSESPE